MSANTPTFRPKNLLVIASIVLLVTISSTAPAAALPADFAGSAVRSVAAWFGDLGRWLLPPGDPSPPDAGTCIDPNGKPKPCELVQLIPQALREAEHPVPAM